LVEFEFKMSQNRKFSVFSYEYETKSFLGFPEYLLYTQYITLQYLFFFLDFFEINFAKVLTDSRQHDEVIIAIVNREGLLEKFGNQK